MCVFTAMFVRLGVVSKYDETMNVIFSQECIRKSGPQEKPATVQGFCISCANTISSILFFKPESQ